MSGVLVRGFLPGLLCLVNCFRLLKVSLCVISKPLVKTNANFSSASIAIACLWSMLIAIWFSSPCNQPVASLAPNRDSSHKAFKVLIDSSCSKHMFCEIEFRLFIPLYKRDRLAAINVQLLLLYLIVLKLLYSLSLSFSQFLGFFFTRELDQSLETFTHHHERV